MMTRLKKEWILPGVLLVLGLLVLSFLVTKIRKMRLKSQIEHFQEEEDQQHPIKNTDRVRSILPYLQVYLLASHPKRSWMVAGKDQENPRSHVWEDLSNYRNDFTWKNGDDTVDTSGFPLKDHSLQGPSASSLNIKNQFTIIFQATSSGEDSNPNQPVTSAEILADADKEGEESSAFYLTEEQKRLYKQIKTALRDTQTQNTLAFVSSSIDLLRDSLNQQPSKNWRKVDLPVLLRLPGNRKNALVVRFPQNHGVMKLEVNGTSYPTRNTVNTQLKTYYSIVYVDGNWKIYQDDSPIGDFQSEPIYLNDDVVEVNPSGKWSGVLHDFAILNRNLNKEQLSFFRQKNLVFKALLEQHHRPPYVPGLPLPDECSSCSGQCICPDLPAFDPFQRHRKPKNPEQCACNVSCACDTNPFPADDDDGERPSRSCPRVTIDENGDYRVEGSNLGSNKKRAREIYQINFPDCQRLPRELRHDYERRHHPKHCPFVVKGDLNPCYSDSCHRVDWKASNPADANLSGSCRRRIDAYCSEHAGLDDFCQCWRPEYQDLPQCRSFVAQFSDPGRRGCDIADYNIEDHPDADKYIRKDKIPCWGCTLDASGKSTCPSSGCDPSQTSTDGPSLSVQANVSLRTSD